MFNVIKRLDILSDKQYGYKQNQTLSSITRIWPTNTLKNRNGTTLFHNQPLEPN